MSVAAPVASLRQWWHNHAHMPPVIPERNKPWKFHKERLTARDTA